MNKKVKTIKKNLYKFIKSGAFRAKFCYTKFYEKLSIDENLILIQSYDGSSISGNPYYLLRELCENKSYEKFIKYVVVRESTKEFIVDAISKKGWKNIKYVEYHSKEYSKILATAKYLINNSTFPVYFIKKENQVYLNTWHGTPLKTLGKSIKTTPNEIGNTQRNFMMSDYLLYPNKYTFEHMRKDYMLENIFSGKYILCGYPRNEIFYDTKSKEAIKKELRLEDKKIVVYMPTWKGSLETKNIDEQLTYIKHAIYEMENKLSNDTVVFVKLHNYIKEALDLNKLKKIKVFPLEYETYEILNIADCLITDYSSVFFDFMNTNKKIIMYAYDYEKYIEERGMYLDLKNLPYSRVYNTDELLYEIKNLNKYKDYSQEMHQYIEYDCIDASKKICDYIFHGKIEKNMEIIEGKNFSNDKKNILLFAGNLSKNGITTAFKGIINKINENPEKNYFITFYKNSVKGNIESVRDFANKDYPYIVIQGQKNFTLSEAICQFLYFRYNIQNNYIRRKVRKIFDREIKRLYPNLEIESVVHFSGYESNFMHIMSSMNSKKIIWAHNNMYKEEKLKQNFHKSSLKYAYKCADKIVVVRDTMKDELSSYMKNSEKNKIVVVHNINDINGIKTKANAEIEFQSNTYCNVSLNKLNDVLNDDTITKFINIARFSKEKGLDQLIKAFNKYREETDENAYLIIVGGYGSEFKNILSMVQDNDENVISENVIIIKSILNPYPILKKCNLFVLSSIYEGLPMTIMEALILDKQIISTDITGPKEFLEQGYGHLVDCSVEGLVKGFKDFKNNNIKKIKKFDSEEFNRNALSEFYDVINNK